IPLDPEWPAGRLETVLADAEPALLVHRGPLPASLDVPALDLDAPGIIGEGELPGFRPDRLAYLIYTSGTTGRPKAVMVEHGSVAAMVGAILDRIGAGPDERVPHLSRYTFDVSLLEMFVPLLSGGACEIVESDEVLDPAGFLAVLERSTRVFTVPALLRRAAAAAQDCGPQRFAGLRTLTSGGDLAPPDLLEELLAAFPSTDILVLYGPTETSIICTGHRLSRTRRPERSLIGRPLDGVEARVMAARGQPVPLGVPGELWVGGPGVARGYFRRDELTAKRFVEVDGRRFYRTGDLVRQVPSEGGELEFLGRVDDQVKVRGFRIEPGEIEAALLDHPDVREAAVMALPAGGDKQLVAWVVGTDDAEALRAFLRGRLPDYMVPAVFVPLDALPISGHGKVDRKALPAPEAARAASAGSAAPRNAREELLAGIWREALGLERVGIHDNFFQLGGDSILSIQIVARARRAGLQLTTRQFFDNQTIAGLAAVADVVGEAEVEEKVEGEVPLTPVQRRFFAEGRREPWRFNQAVLLASHERLETPRLAAALERLARHHDALRLRFVQEADGWRQFYAPAAAVPLLEVDLPPEALEAAVEQLQSGLDLQHGPLFTAALFHLGAEDRLLLTAHHLLVDAVSWRVLLEDLTAEKLPPKTTSWKRWAELLAASSSAEEIPYWQAIPSVPPLPVDMEGEGGRATLTVELGAAETRALLRDAPEVYRTQANDLLLAALARAFASWTGERTLLVDLEGHGREEILPGVDLSRTVGWFTTLFPVALRLPPGAGPRESILAVKETLRAVPGRGLGFGLLKGLLRDRLSVQEPQVSFNYLGRFDAPAGEDGPLSFAPETVRGTEGEAVPGRHLFAVDLLVLEDRLRATWTYDPGRHLPATAERLARSFLAELEGLVVHCLSPEAGGYSPSDFPLAGLDQAALDRLEPGVEDLYPLAPLQEGILFHSLYDPRADPYLEQLTARLEGPLDAPAFAAAWQRVVERHAALRTAFLWKTVDRSLQLVRRRAELPWTVQDWPGEAGWQELLEADRARGFDLDRAPLMRLTLVRTGASSHRLIWTSHHLFFDGWGFPLILSEVFAFYRDPGLQLPPARSYRDFIAWLALRDDSEAERHWREALRGFTEPIPLPFDHAAGAGDPVDRSVTFPAAELEALAQRLRLSLNTLVQGAWALLLSRYSQAMDVVFGAVVSGRPAELPGVESIVGLFINTVPVRAKIPEDEPASAWLARFQAEQVGLRQYQWTPLSRVQALSEVPPGEPLFASLLAFENYPIDPSVSGHLGELRIVDAELDERTNYPLGLTVVARGGDLSLRLSAHPRFEPATAERLLAHLGNLLQALAADPERPPRDLPMFSEGELRQALADWNHTAGQVPDRTLPERFAAQAARTPDAVAVIAGKEKLTYGEIDRRSDELARRLDVEPDSRVALLLGRTPDVPVAVLAAWKAGAAYIPLDPEWPAERLRTVLADAEPALLVHRGPLPVSLDVTALDLAEPGAPGDGELPGFHPDRLAYLIYTSGT
ncbi:MAG: condensation domain-containing protein, partial [Thermoanaerobaculia bacterium]